jgi:hypothetical protein
MSELSDKNFGLVIAYVVPGFVALWGVARFSPTVASWIAASQATAPTVAGFLYVTLGSLAAGLIVSAVRWALVDTLHHATGVRQPNWEFANLDERLCGFLALVENHYRYYQFFGNTFIAAAFTYRANLIAEGRQIWRDGWAAFAFVILEIILFIGSRDTLRKYYSRAERLLGESDSSKNGAYVMTNGFAHKKETNEKALTKEPDPTKKPAAESCKKQADAR